MRLRSTSETCDDHGLSIQKESAPPALQTDKKDRLTESIAAETPRVTQPVDAPSDRHLRQP